MEEDVFNRGVRANTSFPPAKKQFTTGDGKEVTATQKTY